MVRGQLQRSALSSGTSYISDESTINRAVTPPTTVWSPSVDGNDSTSEEPTTLDRVKPKKPTPIPSKISVFMRRVDILGRILVLSLVVYLFRPIITPILRTFDSPLFPIRQLETFVASSINTKSSIPQPNHTYIIRYSSSGKVLTERDGDVVLAYPGSRGSSHWECVQTNGWLGFLEAQDHQRYLGHDASLDLQTVAFSQKAWENFVLWPSPSGGYMLLMAHSVFLQPDVLWGVGLRGGKLAKMEGGAEGGIVWDFIEV